MELPPLPSDTRPWAHPPRRAARPPRLDLAAGPGPDARPAPRALARTTRPSMPHAGALRWPLWALVPSVPRGGGAGGGAPGRGGAPLFFIGVGFAGARGAPLPAAAVWPAATAAG